jgi:hypothetical protein
MKLILDRRSFMLWSAGFALMPDCMTSDFMLAKRSRYTDLEERVPKQELQLSLHSALPGIPGEIPQNELNYQGYRRVSFVEKQWNYFPACVSGYMTATHFALTHEDRIWQAGMIIPNINIHGGITSAVKINIEVANEEKKT